jgi:hypothetical protein
MPRRVYSNFKTLVGSSFEWLVRHERLVATAAVLLVIALVVQVKFCKRPVGTEGAQPQASQTPRPPGSSPNVAGRWEMSVPNRSGRAQTWILTLEQNDDALTGVITSEGGDLPVSGTIEGRAFTLSAKRYGVTVEFPGVVEGDTMTGTMRALTVNRQWVAKRK